MCDTALLLAFFFTPGAELTAPPTPENWALLKRVALEQEVAGPKEVWGTWEYEARWVQGRIASLKGAPRLCEAAFLPDQKFCYDQREDARRHLAGLEERWALCPGHQQEWYSGAYDEACRAYRFWDLAVDMHGWGSWSCRRGKLLEMRGLLGEEDYYSRRWPPAVPARQLQHAK